MLSIAALLIKHTKKMTNDKKIEMIVNFLGTNIGETGIECRENQATNYCSLIEKVKATKKGVSYRCLWDKKRYNTDNVNGFYKACLKDESFQTFVENNGDLKNPLYQ